MPDNNITDLLQRSAISFTGTVERLAVSNVPELTTVDDHTGVVLVDRVMPRAEVGAGGVHRHLQAHTALSYRSGFVSGTEQPCADHQF